MDGWIPGRNCQPHDVQPPQKPAQMSGARRSCARISLSATNRCAPERNRQRFPGLTDPLCISSTTREIPYSTNQFLGSRSLFLVSTRKISGSSTKFSPTRQGIRGSTWQFSSTTRDADCRRRVRCGAGAGAEPPARRHLPWNTGRRFSRKADMPSS